MLEITQVSKSFGQLKVLEKIELQWPSGMLGIAGHNGAGKSTLMRIISGLLLPSSGQILIDQKSPHLQKGLVSYAPSHLSFGLDFSVHFYLNCLFQAQGHVVSKRKLTDLIAQWGITSPDTPLRELSFGNLQKVNVLQATCPSYSRVAIFDEPTNGLDADATIYIQSRIKELAKHKIVLLISHDLRSLHGLCDDIIWLREGQIAHQSKDIFDQLTRHRIIFNGKIQNIPHPFAEHSSGNCINVTSEHYHSAFEYLIHSGVTIRRVEEDLPTLKDIYDHIAKEIA